jgi:two-component system phosphate regulon response regulator PhoB
MMRQRILAVDDDPGMQSFYAQFLDEVYKDRFIGRVVGSAEEALGVLRAEPLDLTILDWHLPGISGIDLLRALRADQRTSALGVIMVTARTASGDAVTALEAGADDHISKPFEEKVLLARLQSLARRRETTLLASTPCREGLALDLPGGSVRVDGEPVRLQPKELELFRVFIGRPNMIHSHRFLWDTVWGYENPEWERIIIRLLYQLRRHLGPRWGPRLEAHRGLGYLLRV